MSYRTINIEHFLGVGLTQYAPCQFQCVQQDSLLFSVCLSIYTAAALSHSVGGQASVAASTALFYGMDRLLLQQHHCWKMDGMVLPRTLTSDATKKQVSQNVLH